MPRYEKLVRVPDQFSKNPFSTVPHHRVAEPASHHDSDTGVPKQRRA